MDCLVCRLRARSIGLLCAPCSEVITTSVALLPQQIVAATKGGGDAALVDQWGRAHLLAADTDIGRATDTCGISILENSVSRRHACVTRTQAGWWVFDCGSSNGTRVNQCPIADRALSHGNYLSFGAVAFFVVFDIGSVVRLPDPAVITSISPARAHEIRASTQPFNPPGELATGPLRIFEPTGGGGGFLELAQGNAQLSATQLELVDVLSRRMREDAHLPSSVRGFVRSSELVGALSWDTHDPDDSHVKQLVRRVRRTLERSGLGDLIESRHRLGYRLRMIPEDEPGSL